ncbi:MAG: capsid cement protein [Bryobacteraceae bacterium]
MKNFVQPGNTLTVTAAATITSGQLVVVGAIIGVAAASAAIGDDVELDTIGVFTLPKVTADVVSAGDKLYWDSAQSKLTKTAGTGSKPLVGVAAKAAGNGVTELQCRLMMTGATGPA